MPLWPINRTTVFFLALSLFAVPLSCGTRSSLSARLSQSQSLLAHSTPPTLADPNHFVFATVGDLHIKGQNTTRLGKMLAGAESEGAAFFLFLGDNADKGLREDFAAIQNALSAAGWASKAFFAIGNHDIFEDGWSQYQELIGPSFYTFVVGNSKFIVLDTADGSVGDTQYDWLRGELKNSEGATNIFLASHYLPVIPGQRTYLKLSNAVEAAQLMSTAKSQGVRAWLGAHYHSFIQSTVEGVQYLVAGGGGERRMEPVGQFFYVLVEVEGSTVRYRMMPLD